MTTNVTNQKSETNQSFDTKGKTKLTRAEFEKKVEIEYCWLHRWEYLSPEEAKIQARKKIGAEYCY